MNGILILAAYAVAMILVTVIFTRKEKNVERFCVGSRRESWIKSALSIAAAWIWAPSLFVSTEKAYSAGWVGLFWFLVPNVLCLIFFIPFAKRIRKEMPEGITLSGYMQDKYRSEGVKRVYLFQLVGLAVLSTGVQLLAGSQILSVATGIPFGVATVLLALIALSYSQFSGIKASLLTGAVQMAFMLTVSVAFLSMGINSKGIQSLILGLSGASGDYNSLWSTEGIEIFLAFGLPTTIGLLSGPFGDQSFWQRAFAVRKDRIGRAFLTGALLFGIVPLSMGVLGFIGAGAGIEVNNLGLANFELIRKLFPAWASLPFLLMVISGLLSTVDSNLCAVSSLATDIARKKRLPQAKLAMLGMLAAGILIANIPGLTVTHLFLFYGTLRASTLLPTVLTLKGVKLSAAGIQCGVISALLIGLPIFAYGSLMDSGPYKTAGSLTTVLMSGAVAAAISRWRVHHAKSAW